MNKLFICLALLFAGNICNAQNSTYIIKLKDKGSNPFSLSSPSSYLSAKALNRRAKYGIEIDSLDLPVTPRYIDSIKLAGNVTVLSVSKWLNQVAIKCSDNAAITKILSFPFVLDSMAVAPRPVNNFSNNKLTALTEQFVSNMVNEENSFYNYGVSATQVKIHNGNFLHDYGFRGQNMVISMSDAGFLNYKTIPTFDSLRLNNQILGTYDFVAGTVDVNNTHPHGTQCLSTIAANIPGVFVGTAPKANFYLFRTEDAAVEFPIEEHTLIVSYEKADSLGANVTSTSLGYNLFDNPSFNHTYSELNGNTTFAARGANIGSSRGMIMMISAGNDGNNPWHYIATPADASDCITVGAVTSDSIPAGFSGYGPNSSGQIKPDFASMGANVFVASTSTGMPVISNGTSFAAPNLAGLVTCLWQAFPEVNNRVIYETLKRNSSNYNSPDDRIGFGIPDMKKSFTSLIQQLFTSETEKTGCNFRIYLNVKLTDKMKLYIERKIAGQPEFNIIKTFNGTAPFINRELQYTDDLSSFPTGTIEYRFKMEMGTDTLFTLGTANLNYNTSCTLVDDQILLNPNPVYDNLTMVLNSNNKKNYELKIYNNLGQLVKSKKGSSLVGRNTINISVSKIPKGIYYAVIWIDNKKSLTKILLKL